MGCGEHHDAGWRAPHEYGPACCGCCPAGGVTLESMFRYGLRERRRGHLSPEELGRVATATLPELAVLATIANLRMALLEACPPRFST